MGGVTVQDLALSLGTARFKNRVFLASGPAGYGTEYAGLIELARLGGIITKTITLRPCSGNAGTRLHETGAGLLNSVGLENVGAQRFFAEKLPELLDTGAAPVVSLAAEEWSEYGQLLAYTARQRGIDAVEINLSCPNVDRGGMAVGTDAELVGKYVRHAKEVLGKTAVIAKLTPNVTDIVALAGAASDAGADAITAINTVVGMDIEAGRPVFRRIRAGLSGPAILPIALEAVWRISREVPVPILASGGISSIEDARKFFMAGAEAVQIGTAIFTEPDLPERIVEALECEGVPAALPG
jgi:dihydroorotate dehydrogenase (NAD+) catalytic subunit